MMETSEEIPDSIEANWVPGQKGTPLLRDNNNFTYRIHMKNKAGTKANYRCVKRYKAKCPAVAVLHIASSRIINIINKHSHEANILEESARNEEKKMIAAAAQVGRISNLEVMTKIKTNLERSDVLEATSSMRKSKALTQAINR
jgi:glucan biosynthesis protein